MNELRTYVLDTFARCCSCLQGTTEEKINFVKYEKFSDEEDNSIELRNVYETDGGKKAVEDVEDVQDNRNKITEWQAGWNVTNAIQVGAYTGFTVTGFLNLVSCM